MSSSNSVLTSIEEAIDGLCSRRLGGWVNTVRVDNQMQIVVSDEPKTEDDDSFVARFLITVEVL